MPELPDVEIFRRRLERGVGRRRIIDAKVKDARLLRGISARECERHLGGHYIRETQRHGKYLIAKLDDGIAFVLHFGMTGTLRPRPRGSRSPSMKCYTWRWRKTVGRR